VKLNADVATAFGVFFDGSFASSYTNPSLKGTYCTAEFTGKSLVLYGSL
jgi:hypothetical protein